MTPDPRVRLIIDQQTPTLDDDVRSMSVFEAENLQIDLLTDHKNVKTVEPII